VRQRDKAKKTQRHKALMRNASKAASRNRLARGKETNVARLERERDELLHQQTAMSEILGVISNSPTNLRPVFDAILSNATRLCGGNLAALWRYDGQYLVGAAQYKASTEFADKYMSTKLELGRSGPARLAALERRTVHVADITAEPGFSPKILQFERARTVLAVPLLRKKELVGVVAIWRREVRPFTGQQIALVQTFAAQAVIAIENTRLLNELRQRTDDLSESLEQQTATSEVLKIISSSPGELESVFHTMLENATRICDASYGAMWLRDGNEFRNAAFHGALPPTFTEQWQSRMAFDPGPHSPLTRMSQSRKPLQVADLREDRAYQDGHPLAVASVDIAGIRTLVCVPMLKDDELVGAIVIYRKEVCPFTDKQVELVKNFAAQAVIAIENTRLLNELRESLQQQTATADVLKVISSSPGELEPVFNAMLENATRICGAGFGTLFHFDGKLFDFAANYGTPSALVELQKRRGPFLPDRSGLLDRVLLTKQVAHSADYAAEQPQAPPVALGGARSTVAVPMLKDNELIVVIYRQEVRPFSEKEIDLVKNFAAQAVIAIENTRLLNELRESLQQQTATADVLKVISGSPGELEPVFQAMLEKATHLCEAKFGVMFRFADDVFRATSWLGNPPAYTIEQPHVVSEHPHNPLTQIVSTKQPVHISDLTKERAYIEKNPRIVALVEAAGARSLLVVPMLKNEELIGAIAIYWQEARTFTEKQMELISNFAAQAVIAIDNARLLSELRESLQQQTATADVLKVISRSTFDLNTVLQTLVESATRLCDADTATITREKDGVFYRAEAYGFSREFMEYVKDIPIKAERGSVSGRALLEGRVVQIPDVLADPEYAFPEGQRLGGFRTLIGVPMLREGVPIGVLTLSRSEVRPFSDRQIELITTFADQAAIAIENVRLFESVEARTRELAKSLEDLRTTQDRLVQTQKLALLGQLTAGIAHEIKNPLNFVNNFSGVSTEMIGELREALEDVSLTETQRKEITELMDTLRSNFDKVVQHGQRADAIVKNMLQHSREGSAEHRVIDINALVEESLNLAWHGARAETQGFEIKLKQSFDPSAGVADVFPQDIRRALLNVMSNGFYAATKRRGQTDSGDYEPTLAASTKDLGDRVEIRIRDNGTGMSPDVKEKMFEPFFTTKPTGEGTGLGLSISHDIIVKQHAGAIEVDSEPGEFTEIRVILPRVAGLLSERS
jgi:two-component system, NtrC family, sensor kinase